MTDKLVVAELQNDGQFECLEGVDFPVTVAGIKLEGRSGVVVPFTEIWRITDNPITPEDQEIGDPADTITANVGGVLYFSVKLGEAIIRDGRDHD